MSVHQLAETTGWRYVQDKSGIYRPTIPVQHRDEEYDQAGFDTLWAMQEKALLVPRPASLPARDARSLPAVRTSALVRR